MTLFIPLRVEFVASQRRGKHKGNCVQHQRRIHKLIPRKRFFRMRGDWLHLCTRGIFR